MGRTKVVYFDEADLPPRRYFGKPYKPSVASWIPWVAIEQIPQGMALEVTPWIGDRKPRDACAQLLSPSGRLARHYPWLRVVQRSPVVFIWYPSPKAAAVLGLPAKGNDEPPGAKESPCGA
jgi:hypothetical protein